MVQLTQTPVAVSPATDTVRVLQLTDCHLCREPGGTLLGMDTDQSLQAVIQQALADRPGFDLVLGTGDLSDEGSLPAYQRLERYFAAIPAPSFWLPGNHDDLAIMAEAATEASRLSGNIRAGNWQLLMLDSQIPGEIGGQLGPDELARLSAALAEGEAQGLNTLLCLHHQPVPIGCAWLDEQRVADADALWALVAGHPGVRGVLWGHVHQELTQQRGGQLLMASPSTCVQFAPGSEDFMAENRPPGYRWLDLHPDGRIDTGVGRVPQGAFAVDLECGGYL